MHEREQGTAQSSARASLHASGARGGRGCCRLVLETHARYCAALREIWDSYKDRVALDRTGTMRIT
jgi:hypothetical protein